MGIYLNPGNRGFAEALRSEIYVDKSELLAYTNQVCATKQKFLCVSRPRRFGKSMAAEMLAAYYSRGCSSALLFDELKISGHPSFYKHLNQYNVIFLNMQRFFSQSTSIGNMISLVERTILWDLLKEYPDIHYFDPENLVRSLQDVFQEMPIPFVFIIDEWDCIFRERKEDSEAQKRYLDFLRNLLKDNEFVGLAYMTGILPIKKYGSHSALNMFDEFSMTDPRMLAEFVGFTEPEVQALCKEYKADFTEMKRWYDGYHFPDTPSVYSPRSVVAALLARKFSNYWSQTETYEALRAYIELNFNGLRDTIVELLAGGICPVNTGTFSNDMTSFQSKDDILTLLIHLGYLGYDEKNSSVFIPNYEITSEFVNAVDGAGWGEVVSAIRQSMELLEATWQKNSQKVADLLEEQHMDHTSILSYNNENALACTLALAYYSARVYYTMIRELPAGKGFADLVFIPRQNHLDCPAMIVELKWDYSAAGAIDQIKQKKYLRALRDFKGKLLLIGINYDQKTKRHTCIIEESSC